MSIESPTAPHLESSPATPSAGPAPGLVLGAAALTMGLLAGLFYAYSVSVMPGLGQADDRTLVDGMQQINDAIENPVFFVSFLGAPVLILAARRLLRPLGRMEHRPDGGLDRRPRLPRLRPDAPRTENTDPLNTMSRHTPIAEHVTIGADCRYARQGALSRRRAGLSRVPHCDRGGTA